ncbi:MAG: rod shape-determining protein RodA [Bacteroidales bacterium]|nr:rod shape-determining protein RodA [Bacteroidales bacterium]
MRDLRGNSSRGLRSTIDWKLILIYLLLILVGWANIYSSVQSTESTALLDFSNRSGKQFIWILASIGLAIIILFIINPRAYEGLAMPIYLFAVFLLLAVIVLGVEVKGSRSWFEFGPIRFQPAEISKISTSLMLAAIMSQLNYRISRFKDFMITALVILVPMGIIIMQSETGSALVYVGFIFMLYREGLSGWLIFMIGMAILLFILTLTASSYVALTVLVGVSSLLIFLYSGRGKWWIIIGIPVITALAVLPDILPEDFFLTPTNIIIATIALLIPIAAYIAFRERNRFIQMSLIALIGGILLVFSTDYIFNNVLQEHQRKRIEVLLGMKEDPSGVGYNVNQSKIAIGSGGLFGKGYMNGTQTTFGFVPEQSTDFIFCTIGEEWGFIGCTAVILLYVLLIWRIIRSAERSREAFTRIYGYCVACCIFMHLFINVGMTLGLMPVIGIPLPLVSYGGSSLWAFTIMIFIFIALDRNERKYF